MKRFIAVAIAFMSLTALVNPAAADQTRLLPHLALRPLKIWSHNATISGYAVGTNNVILDPAGNKVQIADTLSLKAAGGAAAGADTLEPISLIGMPVAGVGAAATVLTDTMVVAGCLLGTDAGGSTIASGSLDSVYIVPQVSVDGVNWMSTFDSVVLGYGDSFVHSGTASKMFKFDFRTGCGSIGNVIPLIPGSSAETRYFPYVRFIVQNDVSAPTPGLQLRFFWSYSSDGTEFGH